jgi:hypothetical protein
MLTNVPGTRLFEPDPLPDGVLVYFLGGEEKPPGTLPFEDAWSGRPDTGHFVFLAAVPPRDSLERLSKALAALPAASHTDVVWAVWDGGALGGLELLPLRATAGAAVTTRTVSFPALPGITKLGVAASSPVEAVAGNDGALASLSIAYPPEPAHDGRPASLPPSGVGIALALRDAGAGCLRFRALLDDPGSTAARTVARKRLAEGSVDPLRPFDPRRTYLRLTGVLFDLAREDDGSFSIAPAGGAAKRVRG